MPFLLHLLAEQHGIKIEYLKLESKIKAIYFEEPGMPPVIVVSKEITRNRILYRCVLAHELGHYFTLERSTNPVLYAHYNYWHQIEHCREEYLAMAWAAKYLIPTEKLIQAFRDGFTSIRALAKRFAVVEKMMELRLMIFFEGDAS